MPRSAVWRLADALRSVVHEDWGHTFDPAARIREKAIARAKDDADLASGARTAAEIQEANSFAKGLDLPNAQIRVRNLEAWDVPAPSPGGPGIPSLDVPRLALQTAYDALLRLDAPELAGQVRAVISGMLERWPAYPPGTDDLED